MDNNITTFLMFEGQAEAAIQLYMSLFANSRIVTATRYGEGEMEGKIVHAIFELNGNYFMASDSSLHHEFTFTPSMSLFVNCESEEEITRLFDQLSQQGKILMPLDNHGFSRKFGWVNDRFGVSWQLNLP